MCAAVEPLVEFESKPLVKVMDAAHVDWPRALSLIDELGLRSSLRLSEDGWLSARQQVLVAFVNDQPVGWLCFHVHALSRSNLEARLDAFGVLPDADHAGAAEVLRDAAVEKARALQCARFAGLPPVPASAS